MRREKNVILDNLEKNKELTHYLWNALDNIVNDSTPSFFKDDEINSKILEHNIIYYLIIKYPHGIKVYSDETKKYFDEQKIKDEQIYSTLILSLPDEKSKEKEVQELNETLKTVPVKDHPLYQRIYGRDIKEKYLLNTTSSILSFNNFINSVNNLIDSKSVKPFDIYELNVNEEFNFDVGTLNFKLNQIYNGLVTHKINLKNKFEFNDLDNHIWLQNDKICFSSQNFVFVASKSNEDWSVYITPTYDKTFKNLLSIKSLISKINDNSINDIENTAIKIIDGKVVFTDYSMTSIFMGELSYNLDALEEEKIINKEIPPGFKLLSPNEYITRSIISYPTLYLKYDFEQSKMAVLGHMFNTIGSGTHDFINTITGKPLDFNTIKDFFGDVPVYQYEKNGQSKLVTHLTDEQENFVYPIEKDINHFHNPYPNFQKQYSLVYSSNYSLMDNEWKQAALDFYLYCKDFFNNPERSKTYHYSFEFDSLDNLSDSQKHLVKDMKQRIQNLSVKQISKDYGTEFIGSPKNDDDIANFLQNRWFKEKEKIYKFLDETISMLEKDLNLTKTNKKKL